MLNRTQLEDYILAELRKNGADTFANTIANNQHLRRLLLTNKTILVPIGGLPFNELSHHFGSVQGNIFVSHDGLKLDAPDLWILRQQQLLFNYHNGRLTGSKKFGKEIIYYEVGSGNVKEDMAGATIKAAKIMLKLNKTYKITDFAEENFGVPTSDMIKLRSSVITAVKMENDYNFETGLFKRPKILKDLNKKHFPLISKYARILREEFDVSSAPNKDAIVGQLLEAEKLLCAPDPNQPFCETKAAPKAAPQIFQPRQRSLDELWQAWCGASDAKYGRSLFCAAGLENPLAMFVMRMRFTLPRNPDKHLLNTLKPYVKGTPAEPIVDQFLAKISRNEVFLWRDFNVLFRLLNLPPVNAGVNKMLQTYGISTETGGPRNPAKYKNLDKEFGQKCSVKADGSKPWDGTLFCELGLSNPTAEFVSRLKFTVPENANNHAIKQLFVTLKTTLEGTKEVPQTWTQYGILKAIEFQLSDVIKKIDNNTLLTWKDLENVFVISTGIPGLEADLEKYILGSINDAIKGKGLEFAR